MPSPFPGMDPYLEAHDVFPGLHDRLICYLSEAIQQRLPSAYFAEMTDRVWVEMSDRTIGPDVTVRHRDVEREGGTATETIATAAVIVTVPHDEHRESLLQIYAGDDRLVTTIEVLSPGNKTAGSMSRRLYQQKQQEILASEVHLLEIDLLRNGEHTTAVPLNRALRRTGRFDYHVCVHRYHEFEDFEVYPIRLRDRLPTLAVPLLPQDADVLVDLQSVFDRAYDTGPYVRRMRYDAAPAVPLKPEDANWAQPLLAAKGLPQ